MLYRNTRRHRSKRASKRSRRRGHKSRRLHFFKLYRKQRGGGYAYEIPTNAIVIRRSLDDDMYSPPTVMTKEQMDEQVKESERA